MPAQKETFEQAVARIQRMNRTRAEREDAIDAARARAARGELKLEPCERCDQHAFDYDDGVLFCGHCGLEYGAPPE